MNRYTYDGPVVVFDECIAHRWKASTYAISENKARSNFAYQFKKQNNRMANCKISLPGKIVMVSNESHTQKHEPRKEKVYERDQLRIEFS